VTRLNKTPLKQLLRTRTRWSTAKRFSIGIVSIVVVSFVAASLVYACPGGDLMRLAHQASAPHGGMVKRQPCNETREDVCKSVRDRLLSLQALPLQANIPTHGFFPVPLLAPIESRAGDSVRASAPPGTRFLLVFKRSLLLLYSVLRI